MREIKFRVWDTKSESMEYEIAIGKGYGEDSYILFLGLGETFIIDDDIVKIMQYTGFKGARNKSEVYEHDIINFLGVGFLKVEWDYKDTGWICLDKRYKKRSLVDVLLSGGIKVGNIYETPELLENNKWKS